MHELTPRFNSLLRRRRVLYGGLRYAKEEANKEFFREKIAKINEQIEEIILKCEGVLI